MKTCLPTLERLSDRIAPVAITLGPRGVAADLAAVNTLLGLQLQQAQAGLAAGIAQATQDAISAKDGAQQQLRLAVLAADVIFSDGIALAQAYYTASQPFVRAVIGFAQSVE